LCGIVYGGGWVIPSGHCILTFEKPKQKYQAPVRSNALKYKRIHFCSFAMSWEETCELGIDNYADDGRGLLFRHVLNES
jgi:hypothetical protein